MWASEKRNLFEFRIGEPGLGICSGMFDFSRLKIPKFLRCIFSRRHWVWIPGIIPSRGRHLPTCRAKPGEAVNCSLLYFLLLLVISSSATCYIFLCSLLYLHLLLAIFSSAPYCIFLCSLLYLHLLLAISSSAGVGKAPSMAIFPKEMSRLFGLIFVHRVRHQWSYHSKVHWTWLVIIQQLPTSSLFSFCISPCNLHMLHMCGRLSGVEDVFLKTTDKTL